LRRILKFYARYFNETRDALDFGLGIAQFIEPVCQVSWADFITTTPVFRLSVHTTVCFLSFSVFEKDL
jgi:hypothetical protein